MGNINWNFWQLLVALFIALISALWVLRERYRHRKDLRYAIISISPIVSISEEAKGHIKILFDGRTVKDALIALIKIINKGVAIPSNHFENPIVFSLGDKAKIMSVEVIDSQPKNLNVNIEINENKIKIDPLLLNTGDFIKIKIIGTKLSRVIKTSTRIIGLKELNEEKDLYTKRDRMLMYTSFSALAIFIISFILDIVGVFRSLNFQNIAVFVEVLSFSIMMLGAFAGWYNYRKYRKSVIS